MLCVARRMWLLLALSVLFSSAPTWAGSSEPIPLGLGTEGKTLTTLHFGANVEYHRPGVFYGTLPPGDPRSTRRAFLASLRENGPRSLRFAGGNCSYWYLYDSEDVTRELTSRLGLGTYAPQSFQNAYFTRLDDFLQFCRDSGIEPVVQLPTMFYNDFGVPRTVLESSYSRRAPDLYDRDRVDEAAAYVGGLVAWTRALGFRVRHWELGNEEFAHFDVDAYMRIATAYAKAVKRECPDAVLYAPVMNWADELLPRMGEAGFGASNLRLTTHYPFGNWFLQPSDVDVADPANYLMADMDFAKNFAATRAGLARRGWAGASIAVTETSVIRFPADGEHSWDPFAIIPSFAHALAFADNWASLIAQPDCVAATFHDLESTYFGLTKFDVYYDRERRRFAWIPPDWQERPATIEPECWFKGRYVPSPTCFAMGMLGELVGSRLVPVTVRGDGAPPMPDTARFLAGRDAHRLTLVALNRGDSALCFRLDTGDSCPESRTFKGRLLTADSLRSVLPHEIHCQDVEVPGPNPDMEIPPYSLVVITRRTPWRRENEGGTTE
ncbi:MAG: hypothetical protein JXR94_09755 [Candidatus Hydrogenedentes bacterium]|nr:hypothetical protein [Candidatus Hydrogenedentota bacterium]